MSADAAPVDAAPVLSVQGLTVRFGGHLAVSDVNLNVPAGAVTGLIGPNGAGKTTCFNAISGVLSPSGGSICFDDRPIHRLSTHRRARLGIARTFQRLEVFGSLTARDNVRVGAEIRRSWSRRAELRQLLHHDHGQGLSVDDEVELIIERLGLSEVGDQRVGTLPTGQARLVELGRALATRPRLLLLDEPASGLDESESHQFGSLVLELAAAGLAVLLVEHDVPLVMRVCDRVTVLDFGVRIAEGTASEIQANAAVLDAYLGGSIAGVGP